MYSIFVVVCCKVWTLGVWGELACHKRLFNPPPQFSRLGTWCPTFLCANVCLVCVFGWRDGGWRVTSFFFFFFFCYLFYLASMLYTYFSCTCMYLLGLILHMYTYMYMDMHTVKTEHFIYCTGEVILAVTGMGHSVFALLPSQIMLHIMVEMLEGSDETQLQNLPPQPSLPPPLPERKQKTLNHQQKQNKICDSAIWDTSPNPNHPLVEL